VTRVGLPAGDEIFQRGAELSFGFTSRVIVFALWKGGWSVTDGTQERKERKETRKRKESNGRRRESEERKRKRELKERDVSEEGKQGEEGMKRKSNERKDGTKGNPERTMTLVLGSPPSVLGMKVKQERA